ncbi:hypothetical protein HY643_02625 [Candidatus Woesearchaeota archaeon]|nr:hypothetical protein [Candidatus Woesearchaeota archaeon]
MNFLKNKNFNKEFYTKAYAVLGIILVAITLYNTFQISSLGNTFQQKLTETKEASKPAEIQLMTIQDSNCEDCFNILPIVESIKKANVKLTKEESIELASQKAAEIIEKYRIEKIPTVIVTGELSKAKLANLEEKRGALVFTQLTPPYTDAASKQVMGKVTATLLRDASCDKCVNMSTFLTQLKQVGVQIASEKIIEKKSAEAKELISKYTLKSLPTIIFSSDLKVYGEILNNWEQIGSVESDGSYIVRVTPPPYFDLTKNKVVGMVSMSILFDGTCADCYNATAFHQPILQNIGVAIGEEKHIDVSSKEGKALVEAYNIEKVPTLILKGDIEEYPSLVNAWKSVGTVETDGTYVFRKVEIAQAKYKNLTG